LQEAVQAARQLNGIWLVRKNAKLLQQPHTEISSGLEKLLQQSIQYARTICSALTSSCDQDTSKQQQLLQAVLQVNVAKVLSQLLHWLCSRPGAAADFSNTTSDGKVYHTAGLCGCALNVWIQLLTLASKTCDNQASLELILLTGDSGLLYSAFHR
jgi:hypothetical protein